MILKNKKMYFQH